MWDSANGKGHAPTRLIRSREIYVLLYNSFACKCQICTMYIYIQFLLPILVVYVSVYRLYIYRSIYQCIDSIYLSINLVIYAFLSFLFLHPFLMSVYHLSLNPFSNFDRFNKIFFIFNR